MRLARVGIAPILLTLAGTALTWGQTLTIGGCGGGWSIGPVQQPLTVNGAPPYQWSISNGSLPTGLQLSSDIPQPLPWWWPQNPTATEEIVGVATTPATATFTLAVTDSNKNTGSTQCAITVSPLTLTDNYQLPDGFMSVNYTHKLSVSGDTASNWRQAPWAPFPAWLSIDQNGQLSGTPNAPGNYNVAVLVDDSHGASVSRGFNLTVNGVEITNPPFLQAVHPGDSVSIQINAQGGTGTGYQFSGTGFPPGVTINSSGLISGTVDPNASPQMYQPTIVVTDSGNNGYTHQFAMEVVGQYFPPSLTYAIPVEDATIGESRSYWLNGWGGVAPYHWSISSGALPPGMALQTSVNNIGPLQVIIAGTPIQTGSFSFTVQMTDSSNPPITVSQPLTINVAALTNDYPPNACATCPSPNLVYQQPMPNFYLRPIGGTPYQWSLVAGSLPSGISLNAMTGIISGTPQESGYFGAAFKISVNNGANSIIRWIGFNTAASPTNFGLNIGGTPPDATTGQPYDYFFNACCSTSPITFSVSSGTLPDGFTLTSAGELKATDLSKTHVQQISFTVQATDGTSTGYRVVNFNVSPLLPDIQTPIAALNQPYPATFTATGGTGALTWTLDPGSILPPGLTFNLNGTFGGAPASPGYYNFSYSVTDGTNKFHGFGSINVAPPAPYSTSATGLGTWHMGTDWVPLSAIGGSGTYSWHLVSGSLPPGLALRADVPVFFAPSQQAGLIGVATTPGTYNFTLSVTSGGLTSSQPFSIKISRLDLQDAAPPDAFVNTAYSYPFTPIGNAGPVTFTVSSNSTGGGMPPGLSLSSAGVLSGTPTAAGSYTIAMNISDGVDTQYEQYQLQIYAVNIKTAGVLPNGTQYQPYSTSLTATGGAGGYTFTTPGGLPNGLTLSPDGTISGTIMGGPGLYGFAVTATDSNHVSSSKQMALDVIGSPIALMRITNLTFDDPVLGDHYGAVQFVCCGGTAPFSWNVTGLPPGLTTEPNSNSFSQYPATPGDLQIYGVPQAAGDYNVQYTVTDATGASTSLTVPMHVSTLDVSLGNYSDFSLPSGQINIPYSATFRVLGGSGPYTFTKTINGELPDGLAVGSNTLTVSGTPLENGSNFNSPGFLFSDSAGNTLFRYESIQISGGTSTIGINGNGFYGFNLGTAPLGVPYSTQFSACCVPSYVWSVAAGSSLPPGLSLSTSGQLSGTPTTSGTYTFLINAADSTNPSNVGVKSFVLTVTPLSITTTSLPYGDVGAAYNNAALQATGAVGTVTWTVTFSQGSQLPPGLTLNSDGTITGAPTSAGAYNLIVQAKDTAGNIAIRGFTIDVYQSGPPPLNLPIGPNLGAVIGEISFQLNATGGIPPYHYSLAAGATVVPGMRVQDGPLQPSSFPAAVTGGYIGVVDDPGTYSTSIHVTDSAGGAFDRPVTLTVSPLSVLSQSPLPNATVGVPYSFTFTGTTRTASGVTNGTYSWSASGLPPGLSMNSSGQVTGTPTTSGSFNFTVTIFDQVNTVSVQYFYTVQVNPFAITNSAVLPQATVNTPYSQTLLAPGCGSGCTWTAPNGTPVGLSLNSNTGVLSGTPNGTFNNSIRIQASGSNGTVQKLFGLTVVSNTPQPLFISMGSNLTATNMFGVGDSVGIALFAQGGTPPYAWSVVDPLDLPPGVSLQSPGEALGANFIPGFTGLSGRALLVGTYNFTLQVTDSASTSVTQAFTLTVGPIQLACCSYRNLPLSGTTLVYNTPYTQPLLAVGGSGTYTNWTALGALPPGLTLASTTGVISGTPSNTGFFSTPIQIADNGGNTVVKNVSFNIASPTGVNLNLAGPNLGTLSSSVFHVINLNPSGGTAPYTITALTPLPSGLSLASGDQLLANGQGGYDLDVAPFTAPGNYSFTLQVTDTAGNIGVRTFSLTVAPFNLFTTTALADGSVGVAYSQQLLTWDNSNPGTVAWSLAPGSAYPPGLSVSGTTISGTPAAAGNYSFQLNAADSSGATITYTFNLRISTMAITNPSAQTIPQQAIIAEPFTLAFTATGGGAVKTWSATGLPPGLAMSAGGTVSGTTYSAGAYFLAVTVTDGTSTLRQNFTLFVRFPDPTLLTVNQASTTLADVVLGQSVSYLLLPSGGVPPYTWQLAPGSMPLPPGLNLYTGAALAPNQSPASTLLEGAASKLGSYSFDLLVTDSAGSQTRSTFTLNVVPLGILAGNLKSATTGVAYSQQLTAAGGTSPTFTYSPQFLGQDMFPAGIQPDATGLISGTPASTGAYYFFATAKDNAGDTYKTGYTLQVFNANGLQVTTAPPFNLRVGVNFIQSLNTNQGSTYTWTVFPATCVAPVVCALPPGLSLSNSGSSWLLSGIPTTPGTYSYGLRATDQANSSNSADRIYTVVVSPMRVQNLTLAPAQQGMAYPQQTFQVFGGTPPYVFSPISSFSPLPPGMSLASNGTFSGTPQATGSYLFSFMVTDKAGASVYGFTTLNVLAPGGTNPIQGLSFAVTAPATVGVPFGFFTLDPAVSGGVPPFTWSVASGSLPPGIQILPGSAGVSTLVAGIPSAAGNYSVNLQATDAAGQIAFVPANFSVSATGPGLSPVVLPNGIVGNSYPNTRLLVSGGTPPYNFQLVPGSTMPPGLALDNSTGAISGTPQIPGRYSINVGVTDSAGNMISRFYSLAVDDTAGDVPALNLTDAAGEGAVQLSYTLTSPAPSPLSIPISATSGNLNFNAMVAGIPGASISASSGTTPATLTLNLDPAQITTPGTYFGAIAAESAQTGNVVVALPITLTVLSPPPCSYSLPNSAGDVSSAGGSSSFGINAPPNCQWAATSNAAWLTTSATGFGTGNATFQFTRNTTGATRTGTITVGGQNYSVTQPAAGAPGTCTYIVNPLTVDATYQGGTAKVTVQTTSNCSWSAGNPTNGLGVPTGAVTGSGSVTVTIPPNNTAATVTMTATVANQPFTVSQTGVNCVATLNSSGFNAAPGGQSGAVNVTVPAGCTYNTTGTPAWIAPVSGASGTASGPFSFSVSPNSATSARSAQLNIGGASYTVYQPATPCSITADTSGVPALLASGGGTASIGVTANEPGCTWTATGGAFAGMTPGSGTGSGSANLTVGPNPGASPRSTSVSIAGQTVTITQAGTACFYTLGSQNASTPYTGGSGSVTVTAPGACSWSSTPDPNAAWLTITSSGSGGTSSVSFVAAPNPGSSPRTGTLTIAGQSFTVSEAAAPCNYTLNVNTTTVASTGTSSPASFTFSTGASGCSVTAASYASWITGVSTASSADGTSGTVTYSVIPNPGGTTRTGTIQVGAQAFTVTQTGAACAFSLNQYGYSFNSTGGAGTVAGSQSAQGCTPVVGSTQPSVVSIGALSGPTQNIWDLPFAVSNFASFTTAIRYGQITFGGQTVYIKQTSW